ncbi:MAG TPA: tail fiber domain-containing protein [Candidatus Saccharimonadales bacterium]
MRQPTVTRVIPFMQMPTGGSDMTLKEQVEALESPLEKILALKPVTWRWKDDANSKPNYGFIAQEVEEIMPELVTIEPWEDGTPKKFLNANNILPYAVGAIKEQQANIQSIHQQLTHLIEMIQQQQQQLKSLDKAINKLNS